MEKKTTLELWKHLNLDPLTHPWGMQITETDAMLGVSQFFWFTSEEELRSAIAAGGHEIEGEESEWEVRRTKVEEALSAIAVLSPASVAPLNHVASGSSRFDWVGQFEELCIGTSDGALWVREGFNDSREDPLDDIVTPVPLHERAAFVVYLSEFGN